MDQHTNGFLEKYSTDELASADIINVVATDLMMPLTSLSETEKKRVDKIVTHISGAQWDKYMSDDDISQTRFEFNVARWAGEEWFQSRETFYRYSEGLKATKSVG